MWHNYDGEHRTHSPLFVVTAGLNARQTQNTFVTKTVKNALTPLRSAGTVAGEGGAFYLPEPTAGSGFGCGWPWIVFTSPDLKRPTVKEPCMCRGT